MYGIEGTSYTAEYWQYDSRLGRRWNIDPMTGIKPWLSPYHVFSNKPIINIDPNGAWDTRYVDDQTGNVIADIDDGINQTVKVNRAQFELARNIADMKYGERIVN